MLEAPSSMRFVALSSMLPNGARNTPFCTMSAALMMIEPPADSVAVEAASPAAMVTLRPGAENVNTEPVVGAIWAAFNSTSASVDRRPVLTPPLTVLFRRNSEAESISSLPKPCSVWAPNSSTRPLFTVRLALPPLAMGAAMFASATPPI